MNGNGIPYTSFVNLNRNRPTTKTITIDRIERIETICRRADTQTPMVAHKCTSLTHDDMKIIHNNFVQVMLMMHNLWPTLCDEWTCGADSPSRWNYDECQNPNHLFQLGGVSVSEDFIYFCASNRSMLLITVQLTTHDRSCHLNNEKRRKRESQIWAHESITGNKNSTHVHVHAWVRRMSMMMIMHDYL